MYQIVFARAITEHLQWIDKKHHAAIRDAIFENLEFEPLLETRNRKQLDPAILYANWELWCGANNRFRVLYDVILSDEEEPAEVHILGIGEKVGERLLIMGTEMNE